MTSTQLERAPPAAEVSGSQLQSAFRLRPALSISDPPPCYYLLSMHPALLTPGFAR